MKPAKRSGGRRATCSASSAAALGVDTPVRPRPVSHSTRTRRLPPRCGTLRGPAAGRASSADHGDGRSLEQAREPRELVLADDVRRQQEVVEAGLGHRLGLAEGLAGEARRAELDLAAGDLDALVRLDVRPVPETELVAALLPPRQVALQPCRGRRPAPASRRSRARHAGSRAIASISTRISPGSRAPTVVRAGYGSLKNSR